MGRVRHRAPSPAMVVAIIALVLAAVGTAVAGVATVSSLSKKDKKQTRNIAKNEINKAAPGLSVGSAAHAQTAGIADRVQNGAIGPGQFAPSMPAAHVTRGTNQSIADSAFVPVAFDSERYDTAAMHDNTTNNSRLTAPVSGIYLVSAEVVWSPNPSGDREIALTVNGGEYQISFQDVAATTTRYQQATTQVRLRAGDYVEAWVFQASGGSLNINSVDGLDPEFSMTWLAPGP